MNKNLSILALNEQASLTGRYRRAIVSVAGDIDYSAGASFGAGDAGAGVAAAARRAAVASELEAVVAAHAAGQV